jgi:hypothetical protein
MGACIDRHYQVNIIDDLILESSIFRRVRKGDKTEGPKLRKFTGEVLCNCFTTWNNWSF